MSALPVLVINRAADAARLARFAAAADRLGIAFERVEAVDGHDPATDLSRWSALLPERFNGADRIKPGAFACALSHARAWERIAATGRAALVCEDDAVLLGPPPAPPEGADLLLCGARIAEWRGRAEPPEPVAAALAGMAARGARPGAGGLSRAPGLEAAAVSPEGARRLLSLLARDGVRSGVDWLILGWATQAARRPPWPEFAGLAAGPLAAFVAGAPAARCAPGPSAIRHGVTRPLAALRRP